jgi:hypothetical protein
MKTIDLQTNFFVCQTATGQPIELGGPSDEMAVLAYSYGMERWVRLTLYTESAAWSAMQQQNFGERAAMLAENRIGALPQVLEYGTVDGIAYYSSPVAIAEPLENYVGRQSGLPAGLALGLIRTLTQNLLDLRRIPRLFRAVSLQNLQLVAGSQAEPERLQMAQMSLPGARSRVLDDGFESSISRTVVHLLYLCLTGQSAASGKGPVPELIPLLDRTPSLLAMMRQGLGFAAGEVDLAALEAALEAAQRQLPTLNQPSAPSALVLPRLRELIFGAGVRWPFPSQFTERHGKFSGAGHFSYAAVDAASRQGVLLHPIPGKRFAPRTHFRSVPEGVAEVDADTAPNLLLPASCWNGADFDFIVEARRPGLSLAEWLRLDLPLSLLQMRRLFQGLQAAEKQCRQAGIPITGLHTSDIFLHCLGADGTMVPPLEDCDVQLRVCPTLRTLIQPGMSADTRVHLPEGVSRFQADTVYLFDLLVKASSRHQTLPLDLTRQAAEWRVALGGSSSSAALPSLSQLITCLQTQEGRSIPKVIETPIPLSPASPVIFTAPDLQEPLSATAPGPEPVLIPEVIFQEIPEPKPPTSPIPAEAPVIAPGSMVACLTQTCPPDHHAIDARGEFLNNEMRLPPVESPRFEMPTDAPEHIDDGSVPLTADVPTLRIDLARLNTGDSLFSGPRTITIRNK